MATWHPKRVGAFVLSGIVLLVMAVLLIGSGSILSRKHTFVSYFTGSVSGLRVGAPVKLRGITIGQVTGVYLTLAQQVDVTRVPVLYQIDERLVRQRGGGTNPIDDPEFLAELIDQGLRAKLELESFVTGQLYVELDFLPDTPAEYAQESDVDHPEIPSVEAGDIAADLTAFVEELRAADVTGLVAGLSRLVNRADSSLRNVRVRDFRLALDSTLTAATTAMHSLATLTESLNAQVPSITEDVGTAVDQLALALQSLDGTLRTTRAALDPQSPVAVRLEESLRELGATARALRELLEYLQRNPSALVRGRAEEEQP